MNARLCVWVSNLFFVLSCTGSQLTATSISSSCNDDGECGADYESMLQAKVVVRETVSQPAGPESKEDQAAAEADEPQTAPRWWVSMAIFFTFALGILLLMVFMLSLLELLVKWLEHKTAEYLQGLDDEAVAASEKKKEEATAPVSRTEENEDIDAREVAHLMNGDHDRFNKLLDMAGCSSPDAAARELIEKASKVCKLSLSSPAKKHAANGLMILMNVAREDQRKRTVSLKAKERLQKAMKQVLWMIKVSRALKLPLRRDHQEQAWTCTADHKEQLADKYCEGHKDSMHGKYKDVRLAKSGLQSYLSSEKFLDHTAIAFVFIYSQVCALVYALYLKYRFPKMYEFMGPWLLVSRGEAMAIIVLTTLMVLMLTRGWLTGIRKYVSWSTVLQTMADKHVLIHRSCGVMLVICAILHIIGHMRGSIPAIIGETDSSKINQAFTYGTKIKFNFNSWSGALRCWPAVTGYILVLLLIAFWSLSNEKVRRYSFELFHYPHLVLIFMWCGCLIAHGWRQWLGCGVPLGLLAVAPVVLLYIIERIQDIRAGHDPSVKIKNAIVKKRQVQLTIDKGMSGMSYETGMYCMLKAPDISDFQWHPFTIASGGGQREFQVLFAIVGDWTTKLSELIKEAQKNGSPYPRICVRGGYGAPAEGMHKKKHVVMVGGGVGATPFLSFLSNICNSAQSGGFDQFAGVESAVFYWVSREADDFAWVNQYNSIVKSTPVLRDRVSIRLCLTKALEATASGDCSATEIALFWLGVQLGVTKYKSEELSKELGAPTQFGRPNWTNEFGEHVGNLSKKIPGEMEISVFACGNQMLVDSLEEACAALTDKRVKMRLYAEEF